EMVVPEVRNVLQEQHDEDVVLVLAGIDGAPEGVARRPGGLVDLLLCNLVGHQAISFWSAAFAASPRMALTSSSRLAASCRSSFPSCRAKALSSTMRFCVGRSGTAISRFSRTAIGIIRRLVPCASAPSLRCASGWLMAQARYSGRT